MLVQQPCSSPPLPPHLPREIKEETKSSNEVKIESIDEGSNSIVEGEARAEEDGGTVEEAKGIRGRVKLEVRWRRRGRQVLSFLRL